MGPAALGRLRLLLLLPSRCCHPVRARGGQTGSGGDGDSGGRGAASPRSRRDLYEVLGVPVTATAAQIKTAYYEQSFRFHPDRNAGSTAAAARFAAVSEAYRVLSSAALRRKYDRGLLSPEELRDAPRPSGRPSAPGPQTPPRSTPATTSSHSSTTFDFDSFYRAHYGEQLEREQVLRARREMLRQRRLEAEKLGQFQFLSNASAGFLVFMAFLVLYSLK